MNFWKTIILLVLAIFLGWGIYNLEKEKGVMRAEYEKVKTITDKLEKENTETRGQLEYYKNPENRLKASRELFNLKSEGEQMLIIVPETSSSAQ